jgi:signal transduction histidine kinase
MSHLRGCRVWVTAAWIAGSTFSASAGVRIDRVVADGQELAVPRAEAGTTGERKGERPRVAVPWGTKRLEFHCSGGWGNDAPVSPETDAPAMARGMRIRHQLDPTDDGWRDARATTRVFIQFHDAKGRVLDTAETTLDGESADWEGQPETSVFHPHRLAAKAPAGSDRVTAHFLSHGGPEIVGWIGIDDIAFTIDPQDGGPSRRHPLPLVVASEPPQPLDTPDDWARRGSRSAIAQLRMRPLPTPHPILVLLDDSPTDYAGWAMGRGLAVAPGDRVQLTWTAAHSLGVGGSTVAAYPGLEPGRYTFRAGAFRPGGEPTGRETGVSFDVTVPWYRRPEVWLIGLTLGIVGAIALARSLALRRIKQRLEKVERAHALERERTRIARDLHDEVGAALTEIAMQHYWVQREVAAYAPPAALARLERARQSAVDLVRSVDAIVWAVNPANDTLDRFVPYLTHSVEQFLEAAGVTARIDVPDHLPAVQLEGGVRHGLLLVVREAVNNAVKHAAPTRVWLTARVADGRLAIIVEDDGCGFDPEAVPATARSGDRSGLGNMRRRAEELGGVFTLERRAEGGTRVVIDVPLPVQSGAAVS